MTGTIDPSGEDGGGGNLNLATYELAHLPAPAIPGATQTVPHQERGHRRST